MDPKKEKFSSCEPSGHSHLRNISSYPINPTDVARGSATEYLKQFDNFAGPYKDYNPPGNRTPAVGEQIWGDHPYLPSYQDPMYSKDQAAKMPDNLDFRGPFYKGVSETHTEYVNRGVLPGKKFHKYVRHYEEPGLKDEISETQANFTPQVPMLFRDKTPCLMGDSEKEWYTPTAKEQKNPHAKELEYKTKVPQIVYVDEGCKREFNTEYNDNYKCFQTKKKGSKIKNLSPGKKEIFLKNIQKSHNICPHPSDSLNTCDDSCYRWLGCPDQNPDRTSQRTDWLFQPSNNTFQNGIILIPCKCRKK